MSADGQTGVLGDQIGVDGCGRGRAPGGCDDHRGGEIGDVAGDPYTRNIRQTRGVRGDEFAAERVGGRLQPERQSRPGNGTRSVA